MASHPTKKSLATMMYGVSEQFVALPNGRPGHWFRRGPVAKFFDFVVIQSSSKYLCFEVDVAVSIFPMWNRQYGRHQLSAATGLPNLRIGSNMINVEDVAFRHDGTPAGIAATLAQIEIELRQFAIPWFDQFRQDAAQDELLQFGLSWIENHRAEISLNINAKLREQLIAAEFRRDRVVNETLDTLKRDLRILADQINASKWHRQQTGVLALDLLNYAACVSA